MDIILITVVVLGYIPISRLIKLHTLNLWSFFFNIILLQKV